MAVTLLSRHVEALPGRGRSLQREGVRVVGAFAALLAAALLVTAGLLWRENARTRPQPAAAAATHGVGPQASGLR